MEDGFTCPDESLDGNTKAVASLCRQTVGSPLHFDNIDGIATALTVNDETTSIPNPASLPHITIPKIEIPTTSSASAPTSKTNRPSKLGKLLKKYAVGTDKGSPQQQDNQVFHTTYQSQCSFSLSNGVSETSSTDKGERRKPEEVEQCVNYIPSLTNSARMGCSKKLGFVTSILRRGGRKDRSEGGTIKNSNPSSFVSGLANAASAVSGALLQKDSTGIKNRQGSSSSEKPRSMDGRPESILIVTEPHLGWRNVTHSFTTPQTSFPSSTLSPQKNLYPTKGFGSVVVNERDPEEAIAGNFIHMVLNIANRSANLAERYGLLDVAVADPNFKASTSDNGFGSSEFGCHDINRDLHGALLRFKCPDYGWRLKARYEISEETGEPIQLMTDHHGMVHEVNVVEVAANIGEQLHRLEGDNLNWTPCSGIETYGWLTQSIPLEHPRGVMPREELGVVVVSPEGEALVVVPEEVLMNVASWVKNTYLTSPLLNSNNN